MLMLLLLSQVPADGMPTSMLGMGILGILLGWILFLYVPARHKESREMISEFHLRMSEKDRLADVRSREYDKIQDEHAKAFREAMRQAQLDFKASLDKVVEHCEEEIKFFASHFGITRRDKDQ